MKTAKERREYSIQKSKDNKRREERNGRRRNLCAEFQIAIQVNSILGYLAMVPRTSEAMRNLLPTKL